VGQLARAFNRMAESLEKIEKLRRNLMIDVAHELRTPLTNIRGYLEAVNDGVLPPSPETLSLLQEETMRLIQLAEDVLELAKADEARGHLQREPTDLRAEIDAALAVFSRAFAQNAVAVKIHAPGRIPVVSADRRRIARVLRCLTENAVQYAPSHSQLDIRIGANAGRLRVEYSNEAGEIGAADLPYIFERFYRGDKSRSRERGGAGIGLAIVKELVEAHGGRVGADLCHHTIRIWFELPTDSYSAAL
jgi:two-component system sensor histidine kinase BaeS